ACRRGRCANVPGARSGAHSPRVGDGGGDPGRASANPHGKGARVTTAPELTAEGIVERWISDNSWNRPRWTVPELQAAKAGRSVSVVLPALNEGETVGEVVASIAPLLGGLVDELVVLDSGSTDDT